MEALLSMDHRRWFTSVSDQSCAFGRHNSKTAARFLIEYQRHVGWCCRIALLAARRPPLAQADFKISSNSGVQRQVFPRGFPYFCLFTDPTRFRRCDVGVVTPAFGRTHSWGSAPETEFVETTRNGTAVAANDAPVVPPA
jgi:hypothetical protein